MKNADLLSGYVIKFPKFSSETIVRASMAALDDQLNDNLGRVEEFLAGVREVRDEGGEVSNGSKTHVRRLFQGAVMELEMAVRLGLDARVFRLETGEALQDMVSEMRADAQFALTKAFGDMDEGVNLSQEILPTFAVSARQQLAWVRSLAKDLLDGQKLESQPTLS